MNPTQIGTVWGKEEGAEGGGSSSLTRHLLSVHAAQLRSKWRNGECALLPFSLVVGHFLCLFCFWFLFASRFAAGFIVSLNRRQSANQRLAQVHMCVCVCESFVCVCVWVGAEFVCLACAWQTNNTQKGKTNGNANAPLRLSPPPCPSLGHNLRLMNCAKRFLFT